MSWVLGSVLDSLQVFSLARLCLPSFLSEFQEIIPMQWKRESRGRWEEDKWNKKTGKSSRVQETESWLSQRGRRSRVWRRGLIALTHPCRWPWRAEEGNERDGLHFTCSWPRSTKSDNLVALSFIKNIGETAGERWIHHVSVGTLISCGEDFQGQSKSQRLFTPNVWSGLLDFSVWSELKFTPPKTLVSLRGRLGVNQTGPGLGSANVSANVKTSFRPITEQMKTGKHENEPQDLMWQRNQFGQIWWRVNNDTHILRALNPEWVEWQGWAVIRC